MIFHFLNYTRLPPWILDVILIALVSKVTLLVWLSNFAQCWLPCARLNPVARILWAPSTAQILKVTLIEWLLQLTLLEWHQVFRTGSSAFFQNFLWNFLRNFFWTFSRTIFQWVWTGCVWVSLSKFGILYCIRSGV